MKKHGSSWYNVSELNSTKNSIFEWVNSYVNSKKINGMLNFKFIESKENGDVYCTQANPHIHSAIVNFHAKSEVFIYFIQLDCWNCTIHSGSENLKKFRQKNS